MIRAQFGLGIVDFVPADDASRIAPRGRRRSRSASARALDADQHLGALLSAQVVVDSARLRVVSHGDGQRVGVECRAGVGALPRDCFRRRLLLVERLERAVEKDGTERPMHLTFAHPTFEQYGALAAIVHGTESQIEMLQGYAAQLRDILGYAHDQLRERRNVTGGRADA
jgi:hypothetical protein